MLNVLLCFQNYPLLPYAAKSTFIRERIHGDVQTSATCRTTPAVMAYVSTYDPKELLVILFNHVTNFLSLGCGRRLDSEQCLAISLRPFRPTIGAESFINTHNSLCSRVLLNIQNLKGDYCFLWCFLMHVHRVGKHSVEHQSMNLSWMN